MAKGPRSLASIFEARGNPWITDKEGREEYKRNDVFDNPDLDQFTKATLARHDPDKVGLVRRVVREEKNVHADPYKRLSSIARRMNEKLHKLPHNNRDGRKALNRDEPDFQTPPHHVGVDLLGRDIKQRQDTAKQKARRRKPKPKA